MFKICIFFALLAVVLAGPTKKPVYPQHQVTVQPADSMEQHDVEDEQDHSGPQIAILDSGSVQNGQESYAFHFSSADGTRREETGEAQKTGSMVVHGAYSFVDADGNQVVVNYTADDHGFVPVGSNIHQEITAAAKQQSQKAKMESQYKTVQEDGPKEE